MKTGRRIADPTAKALAGTFRKDRHASIAPLAIVAKVDPTPPTYLSDDAKAIWAEDLPRAAQCGVTEVDSSFFARYCVMEAAFRTIVTAGDIPKAALMTELRRSAELLGIAGTRSRLAKAGGTEPTKSSPFTVLRAK